MKAQAFGRFVLPALLVVALVFAWMGTEGSPVREYSLDAAAKSYVDAGLKRALVTFATARTLDAFLSLAQGTQIAVQPLGVGVQVSVGQILHPINEVVRQFADLMLIASMAFVAMEILIRVGSHWSLALALSIVAVIYATHHWKAKLLPAWVGTLLLVLLVLRFAVPIVSLGSDGIYMAFMADKYAENQQAIKFSSDQLGEVSVPQPRPGPMKPWWCRPLPEWFCSKASDASAPEPKPEAQEERSIGDRMKDLLSKSDIPARLKEIAQVAGAMTEHIVNLMVLFLLQTLVIPLVLGWILLRGIGALLQSRSPSFR